MPKALSAAQFVEVWQRAASLTEVAAQARTSRQVCSVRASTYRKQGIPLKWFHDPRKLDVAALAGVAKRAVDGGG